MRLVSTLLISVWVAGCVFAQPPAEPRYFSPAMPESRQPDPPRRGDEPQLRLRRVRGAAYLRDRMVWRRGVEIGFYDLLRWTESPARFAQARLEDELFERRGLQRSNLSGVPALSVSLEAFDELLAPAHEASVALAVELVDAQNVTLLDHTYAVRKPISGGDPKEVADALGAALDEAAQELGAGVAGALGVKRP